MFEFINKLRPKDHSFTRRLTAAFFVLVCLGFLWPTYFMSSSAKLVDSVGMKFVLIPSGEFWMGNKDTALELIKDFPKYEVSQIVQLDDERPLHHVKISKDFYLGVNEVTLGQFARFLSETNYLPESVKDGKGAYGYVKRGDQRQAADVSILAGPASEFSFMNTGFDQSQDHPVVNVSWNDAMAMAAWLTEKEGVRYRLPTEAEWEYACLANQQKRYSQSNRPEDLSDIANTFDQEAASTWSPADELASDGSDGFVFTAPIGSYSANAFGVKDMLGNVSEWVVDDYDPHYYYHSLLTDPQGPETNGDKVHRGGAWNTSSLDARCASRSHAAPSGRHPTLGFRLVREAS